MTLISYKVNDILYTSYLEAQRAANGNKQLITTIFTSYYNDEDKDKILNNYNKG